MRVYPAYTPPTEEPARCRSCDAEILWATTLTNKRMPIDPEPVEGGNLRLDLRSTGELRVWVRGPQTGVPMHRAHFATCPDAESWRKR